MLKNKKKIERGVKNYSLRCVVVFRSASLSEAGHWGRAVVAGC
jgi:hypothetical protein